MILLSGQRFVAGPRVRWRHADVPERWLLAFGGGTRRARTLAKLAKCEGNVQSV